MLGFARKAGALLTGTFSVEKGLQAGKVLLVVADEALEQPGAEEMERQCQRCGVPASWQSGGAPGHGHWQTEQGCWDNKAGIFRAPARDICRSAAARRCDT